MVKYYLFIAVLACLCVGLVVGGFVVGGSPISQRDRQLDAQRLYAFSVIKSQIELYYGTNHQLPDNLDALKSNSGIYANANLVDPGTNRTYDYKMGENGDYQLCTTFSTDGSQTGYTSPGIPAGQTHKKGYDCLSFTIPLYLLNRPIATPFPMMRFPFTIASPLPNQASAETSIQSDTETCYSLDQKSSMTFAQANTYVQTQCLAQSTGIASCDSGAWAVRVSTQANCTGLCIIDVASRKKLSSSLSCSISHSQPASTPIPGTI